MQALQTKLSEVTQTKGLRDAIAVEQSADPLDTTQRALEREMATVGLDRNATLARQIRAAISRINQGGYGLCLECEEPISQKRLAAVPWAALCIHCQQRADHANRSVDEWLDDGFATAA
jgi:DnaK suppressor protein